MITNQRRGGGRSSAGTENEKNCIDCLPVKEKKKEKTVHPRVTGGICQKMGGGVWIVFGRIRGEDTVTLVASTKKGGGGGRQELGRLGGGGGAKKEKKGVRAASLPQLEETKQKASNGRHGGEQQTRTKMGCLVKEVKQARKTFYSLGGSVLREELVNKLMELNLTPDHPLQKGRASSKGKHETQKAHSTWEPGIPGGASAYVG